MEMVYRQARAIMMSRHPDIVGGEPGCIVVDWEREAKENVHVEQALMQAKGVIEAMKEPTDRMVMAGEDALKHGCSARSIFVAMIEAASESGREK